MNKTQFEKELIKLFAKKTSCSIQFGGCPCNTCFHSIEGVDFQHICWIILIYLRGDYKDYEEGIKLIKKELFNNSK